MNSLSIPFGPQDQQDLEEFKSAVETGDMDFEFEDEKKTTPLNRHVVSLPEIKVSSEGRRKAVENALDSGATLRRQAVDSLPEDMVENAKAAFISSGGNVSEVAALFDLTPEMVLRLATDNNWPVYGGSTKVSESKSKGQLEVLKKKLWHKVLGLLDSMEVETKAKESIVQHRVHSEYVESLSARSTAFKAVFDQYMRVSTLLEPETFAVDPDGTNMHARNARGQQYPGGVEGVNREMADLLSEVVVGIVDKARDRDLDGYGKIIDTRQKRQE